MPLLHSKILGKGKPLLILHGLLGMGDNWITLARRYSAEGFQVHLIDQRNHGKSFHSEEMNYEVMTQDLHHYITHHQLQKSKILGHSMGGKTAMYYAVTYPEKVSQLVIVDIAPVYYPPHHHFIFDAMLDINLSKYTRRSEILTDINQKIDNPAISNFIVKNLRRDHLGFHWKPHLEILANALEELGSALPVLASFDKDTLFIKGEKSHYIKAEHKGLINAHFPQNILISIANAGHWVHAEQPRKFFNETLAFLNK